VDRYVRARNGNTEGELTLGVRTFDAGALQRGSSKEFRVTFYCPLGSVQRWVDVKPRGGESRASNATAPLHLSRDSLGEAFCVAHVAYGREVPLPWDHVPTAKELAGADLYAAVWVRLEELSPADADKERLGAGSPNCFWVAEGEWADSPTHIPE